MATSHLNELLTYFEKFKKTGFISSIITAKEYTNNLGLKFIKKKIM